MVAPPLQRALVPTISYSAERIIGHGSFGMVFQATTVGTGEVVAIKKVLQDKRYKNRERQIMRQLKKHPNIVELKHTFLSGKNPDEMYLNLVMEYIPDTLHSILRRTSQQTKHDAALTMIDIKLYMYQLCRSLAYIHAQGICHRDIKPQNLLVDAQRKILKVCDFGSAKMLVHDEPSVSYICSRNYRAPELIFGSTGYTTTIDLWSMGCVAAELLLGQPLFAGESSVDQLVEIIKVLGTPTREEIHGMNPNYTEFQFPQIKPHPWNKVLPSRTPPQAAEFISKMLAFAPKQRLSAFEALVDPFFDELRDPAATLGDGRGASHFPQLFDFTAEELSYNPAINHMLIPEHTRTKANWPLDADARCA